MGNWVMDNDESNMTRWEYKGEPLNPWILGKRLALFLQSKGIDVCDNPPLFDAKSGLFYHATYNGFKILLMISCNMRRISISSPGPDRPKESETIDSFAEIIGEFLITGYEPDDKAEFERFVRKYTPVRMETGSHFDYHNEVSIHAYFFNADGENFDICSYYFSEVEDVWRELIELGKENNSD